MGLGAAAGFVGGAALAATIAQSQPSRANFLLSLFYAGPGLGILSSGLIAPFVLQAFGPGSWWIVWWALTLLSIVMTIPLLLTPIDANAGIADAAPARFAIRPVLIYLVGYFLFGAGYIAYMTFMIAYVRDAGGGAAAQSAFWCLIGVSAFVTPWVWRGVLALDRGGVSTAIILGVNASARRCRCSDIPRPCSPHRRWCSASRSSRWSARPPLSCASIIRPRPGRRRSRR